MTFYELKIVADTNDADYVTSTTKITMEQIEQITPVIEAIKEHNAKHGGSYNWPNGEWHDETVEDTYPNVDSKLLEIFSDYCPYGENGIHTIESVEYYPLPDKVKLL